MNVSDSQAIQGELEGLSVELERALSQTEATQAPQQLREVHVLLQQLKARVDKLQSDLRPFLTLLPDPDDDELLELFVHRRTFGAAVLHRVEMKRLQDQGIIDAKGNRVRKSLPPDMREGSTCDV